MSFQITILKVLAGHPEGQASLADLTYYVSVLTSSGMDWSQRMKRLAACAPGLDIFTSGYVIRDSNGWQITDAGRDFLKSIEAQTVDAGVKPVAPVTGNTKAKLAMAGLLPMSVKGSRLELVSCPL